MSCPARKREKRGGAARSQAGALYVHVPFCRSKCRYCDFYSIVFEGLSAEACVDALLREIAASNDRLRCPLESIYVGGGTPTVIGPVLLRRLLSGVQAFLGPDTEFTVEANPGTVSRETAAVLVESGVNRVSLGVQSFQDDELVLLGRAHTAAQAAQAVDELLARGLANISADLIYGIPSGTRQSWQDTLARTLAMPIRHLSCYALSIEPGTAIERDVRAGRLTEMQEAAQKDCYLAAIDAAQRAGMTQYEISNFSHPGFQCRHNLTYWHNEPYLGIGPGAASYLDGVRRKNCPQLGAYLAAIGSGRRPPAKTERLSVRKAMAETLMLGLRLTEGVDRTAFKDRFGADPLEAFPHSTSRYAGQGALLVTARAIRVNPQQFFVSNTILADILAEA